MADELLKVYIEPSSRCNLACTMCFRKSWINEALSDMEMETFTNAIDTMPDTVRTVFFGGMGEPLIHNDIAHMVGYASCKGVRAELLTNATLLTREVSRELLDRGLDMLWASIDSVDEGEYEKIRRNSSFPLIKRNIYAFNAERATREKPAALGIAFVAMKSNVQQLGKLNRFAYDNNVCDINISNVSPTGVESLDESLYERIVSLGLGAGGSGHPRISIPVMDSRIEQVREGMSSLLGMDYDYLPTGSENVTRRRRYCRFINEGAAFVRHDGEVSPCMAVLHSGVTYLDNKKRIIHHHSFGNAGRQSLREIWESEEYTAFRSRVREFDFSPCVQCGGCENRDENMTDCFGNKKPTCGACLWSEGVLSCP